MLDSSSGIGRAPQVQVQLTKVVVVQGLIRRVPCRCLKGREGGLSIAKLPEYITQIVVGFSQGGIGTDRQGETTPGTFQVDIYSGQLT